MQLEIELVLSSDAELGTGLGTEALDDLVPRDEHGKPIVPASHLKGLVRDRLETIASWMDHDANGPSRLLPVLDALLGRGGEDGADGQLACLRVSDLRLVSAGPATLDVQRTALGPLGTAFAQSLRSVEAVRAGTVFEGHVQLAAEPGDALDLACRLGLLSIEAIGATRSRGAGLCRIRIAGESRSPGALSIALEQTLARTAPATTRAPLTAASPRALRDRTLRWYRLEFVADSPVCCPEQPVLGANVIRSGPVIPASAVQGALLTLLDAHDPGLASATFGDAGFRAWPLSPVASVGAGGTRDVGGFGVRVDLAHRMSKQPLDEGDEHVFFDSAIAPYHWSEAPTGASLKSSDGVLVRRPDGSVGLWRAQDLPRVLRAHGVHAGRDGQRNLFTVEALAPLVYSGLITIPAEAGELLHEISSKGATVSFGKARTVRGSGTLAMVPIAAGDAPWNWRLAGPHRAADGRVFVVQSPLALPDDWRIERAEEALQRLAAASGWGELLLGDPEGRGRHGGSVATLGVRFGWNRHGLGTVVGIHRRLRARRVVLPGSVLVFRRPVDRLEERLRTGLGDGREQGFGAVLPHPGVAQRRLPALPKPPELRSEDWARLALRLWREAGGDSGPSASQIGALAQRVQIGADPARRYLDDLKQRPPRIWAIWEPVRDTLLASLASESLPKLARALRAWQDLRVGMNAAERQEAK